AGQPAGSWPGVIWQGASRVYAAGAAAAEAWVGALMGAAPAMSVEKAYSMLTTIEPNGRIIIPHQSSRLPHPRGEPVPGRGQPTHARPPADRTVVAASQSA